MLGGVAFRPDQLERELCWIDEQVKGKPYGVDIIVPAKYEGKGENPSRVSWRISSTNFGLSSRAAQRLRY